MQVSGQLVEFSIRKQEVEEDMSDSSCAVPKSKLSSRFESSDYRLVDVRGIPQNSSLIVSRFESVIDTFQTRDGDVFLSTFVKAGILLYRRAQSLVLSIRLFCYRLRYIVDCSYCRTYMFSLAGSFVIHMFNCLV